MRGRLLNLLTLLSMLLCTAMCGLWVWGQWWREAAMFGAGGRVYHFGANSSGLFVAEFQGVSREYRRDHPVRWRWDHGRAASYDVMDDAANRVGLGFAGFRHAYSQPHPYASHGAVLIPYWAPACLLALLPAARLIRRIRRHPAGGCRRCGYDLRATPERCPECGTAVGGTLAGVGTV